MGRKKQKSRVSSSEKSPRETAASAKKTAKQQTETDLWEASAPDDWLEVRLYIQPHQSKANTRDSQKEKLLYLSKEDACRIDIVDGDSVFVLARDNANVGDGSSDSVTASAVCSARIADDCTTPNKQTSPGGLRTPRNKQSRLLSQGTCRVSPPSLAIFLCTNTCPDDEHAASESNVSPSMREALSTASGVSVTTPSTPSFSFAKGGGGDRLISPSSSETVKSTKWSPQTPVQSSSFRNIWIVPLQCALGERILNMLSFDASRISLHLSSCTVDDRVWLKSQQVMRRLVLAYQTGSFVHKGDVVGISFQGKALDLKVQDVETASSDESITKLSQQVANVDLGTIPPEEETLVEAIRRSLGNRESRRKIHLYKIVSTTEIALSKDNSEMSLAPDNDSLESPFRRVVAGLDATLEHVKSLLLPPLVRSDLFKNHSLRLPRGVLLHGPSGVGKSLLAEQIKLDLLQSNVHVRSISCSSLQSRTAIVGEAERQLSDLFESIQRHHDKPGTLLILDDIHLICSKRGGHSNNQGADRLAATLLALLDGIGTTSDDHERGSLVILGITSNLSLLDPALRRPGRMDSEVEVPIPDEVSRAAILKFQLESLRSSAEIPQMEEMDYMALSRLAKGFNGADVMLAIKEALRKAVGESSGPELISLTRSHLEASIRATKPSTISSITVEIPQVHWNSIGGMESVKQKLREAIELPVTHAHLFEAFNIPPPRGVLLYGPPGCSKTLMARALATEGQMNFLAVKGPELLSKWLGESERALASLFRRARLASPCIIFFDEIDAIASKRGGVGDGGAGGERLLSQLLTELDGVGSSTATLRSGKQERVVVVGATNRPDLLDSALTRPGRIDRMIYVGLPDESSRGRIFEIGLKGKACSEDVEFSVLASDAVSGGFSGAELIAICREAALLAIEEGDTLEESSATGSPRIAMRHLMRAVSEMNRQITPEMLDFYASFNSKLSR